jgi:pimeloyl-ACP methyl ester carboxylesterase
VAPTVAELAVRVRAAGAGTTLSGFDPVVAIRPQGTKPPLFYVHPMGGNVLCYVPFAKHLPPDQPFYAFQAAGADVGTEPVRGIERIAAGYIEAMRRVQPTGPYHLGGWSFGGFVAFEMARQLHAAGERVGSLVLLDIEVLVEHDEADQGGEYRVDAHLLILERHHRPLLRQSTAERARCQARPPTLLRRRCGPYSGSRVGFNRGIALRALPRGPRR